MSLSDWLFWAGVATFFVPNLLGIALAFTPWFGRFHRVWENVQMLVYLSAFGFIVAALLLNMPPKG